MATDIKQLENELRNLDSREKASLARSLIDDLDSTIEEGSEQLWMEEAQRRYQEYRTGKIKAVQGEEAMQRARQRLK